MKFERKKLDLLRTINFRILKLTVFFIGWCIPEKKIYKALLFVSFFSRFKITHLLFKKYPLRVIRAFDINYMLDILSRKGKIFPIPYQIYHLDKIQHTTGLMICTLHLPLSKIIYRILHENQLGMQAVIAANPSKNAVSSIWGLEQKMPVLKKNESVLLKVKQILEKNQRVGLMIDQQLRGQPSPQIFHFCQKVKSKVIFFHTELKSDGKIVCTFMDFPHPNCETEASIQENLRFLNEQFNIVWKNYQS